jgi:hypothetical protein
MLIINFIPDSDREDLSEKIKSGLDDYKKIWKNDSTRVVKAVEKTTGLKFIEKEINAIVFSSTLNSRSFPLSLNADLELDIKKGLLVHELCHRLLSGNHIRVRFDNYKDISLEIHKVLNLILYDIWVEVYGTKLANKMVEWESRSRRGIYKKAWDWALGFDKKERKSKFNIFRKRKG